MKYRAIALVAALFLAGCSKKAEEAETNNVAAPAPAPIEPGLYRQATTLLELKDPSMSAAETAAAAKQIGATQTADRCVTAEMISNPKKLLLSGEEQGCKIDKSLWDGGKIDLALTCPEDEDTGSGAMTLTGSYDKDRYAIEMVLNGDPGEVMRMKVDAKRLGDCPAAPAGGTGQ